MCARLNSIHCDSREAAQNAEEDRLAVLSEDLADCPLRHRPDLATDGEGYWVECRCGARIGQISFSTAEEAMRTWNDAADGLAELQMNLERGAIEAGATSRLSGSPALLPFSQPQPAPAA